MSLRDLLHFILNVISQYNVGETPELQEPNSRLINYQN